MIDKQFYIFSNLKTSKAISFWMLHNKLIYFPYICETNNYMENISTQLVSKTELSDKLKSWFETFYNISFEKTIQSSLSTLNKFVDEFKDDLKFLIEYPYVDKMYRDSYYHYFSSKTLNYSRNCIRISLFKAEFEVSNQYISGEISDNYLGFLVIRPTFPKVVGRNVISPYAFKVNDINICNLKVDSTANYLKVKASGFPHSTQDTEMISCAETTLWSIVEYFSGRYSNYPPLLPSAIHNILSQFSFERQIPSKGLRAAQISFALKKIGFGVRIYSKNAFDAEFESNLRIYIESGIPIVGVIQNPSIGHAVNIIGRKDYTSDNFSNIPVETLRSDLRIKDIANCDTEIVLIDDNYPPYRISTINDPSSYYTSTSWRNCKITNFIVPLYPKIYMEAGEARKISKDLLSHLPVYKERDMVIKTFLTSSRSYKNYILKLTDIDDGIKKILLSLSMPKFIWVTEIFDENDFLNKLCEGIIILDATEPKEFHIIGSILENIFLRKDNNTGFNVFRVNNTKFQSFNNLEYYGTN